MGFGALGCESGLRAGTFAQGSGMLLANWGGGLVKDRVDTNSLPSRRYKPKRTETLHRIKPKPRHPPMKSYILRTQHPLKARVGA